MENEKMMLQIKDVSLKKTILIVWGATGARKKTGKPCPFGYLPGSVLKLMCEFVAPKRHLFFSCLDTDNGKISGNTIYRICYTSTRLLNAKTTSVVDLSGRNISRKCHPHEIVATSDNRLFVRGEERKDVDTTWLSESGMCFTSRWCVFFARHVSARINITFLGRAENATSAHSVGVQLRKGVEGEIVGMLSYDDVTFIACITFSRPWKSLTYWHVDARAGTVRRMEAASDHLLLGVVRSVGIVTLFEDGIYLTKIVDGVVAQVRTSTLVRASVLIPTTSGICIHVSSNKGDVVAFSVDGLCAKTQWDFVSRTRNAFPLGAAAFPTAVGMPRSVISLGKRLCIIRFNQVGADIGILLMRRGNDGMITIRTIERELSVETITNVTLVDEDEDVVVVEQHWNKPTRFVNDRCRHDDRNTIHLCDKTIDKECWCYDVLGFTDNGTDVPSSYANRKCTFLPCVSYEFPSRRLIGDDYAYTSVMISNEDNNDTEEEEAVKEYHKSYDSCQLL